MANTLLITKETGGFFSFVLNGVTANKVTNTRNDLLVVGTECHFKTANGANLVKNQQINATDVTLIDSGTFTFATPNLLFDKLIEAGYFSWITGGGAGTGVNRFDDLLDTFKFTLNSGYVCVVNTSEQKLEAVPFYNYRNFTELEDAPDVILPNKMLVGNAQGNGLIFVDVPNAPETQIQVNSDWNAVSGDALILNKPLNLDDTSDLDKPISNDTNAALATKLDTSTYLANLQIPIKSQFTLVKKVTDNATLVIELGDYASGFGTTVMNSVDLEYWSLAIYQNLTGDGNTNNHLNYKPISVTLPNS